MRTLFLQAKGISKQFYHVQALNQVDLEIYSGEVLAIVGDNGAGKSTFIKLLSGTLKPDEGILKIYKEEYKSLSPKEALKAGISTVYQDLALGDTKDVSANIFLGQEISRFGVLNKKRMWQISQELINQMRVNIPDVTVPVGLLSGGQRQAVAVARLMRRGGQLFIFDEPTAAMGFKESQAVLELLKQLAQSGKGVILISHNLPQVFQISDRIAVFRQGRVEAVRETCNTDINQIVSLITGSGQTNGEIL